MIFKKVSFNDFDSMLRSMLPLATIKPIKNIFNIEVASAIPV